MYLPSNLMREEEIMTSSIVAQLKTELKAVNPFINDFIQICEYPDNEVVNGKLVISAKSRPRGEHERRYNEQLCLSEVRILSDNHPHDLVLKKRGGGL